VSRRHEENETVAIQAPAVDFAVELLDEEQGASRSTLSLAWREFANDLLAGACFFCIAVGLAVVWWHWVLALVLFGLAFAFLMGLASVPSGSASDAAQKLKARLEDPTVLKAPLGSLARREEDESWLTIAAFLLGPLAAVVGLIWLVSSQLSNDGAIPIAAILLIALPSLIFWVALAVDATRDYAYYNQVSGVLERIKAQTGDETPGVEVTQADLDVLSNAETQYVKRKVEEATEQLPDVLSSSYSVIIEQKPQEYLDALPAADTARIMQRLLDLSVDPHPAEARPESDDVAATIAQEGLGFVVDDETHCVVMTSVEEEAKTDA
jgi:hypothetical protein